MIKTTYLKQLAANEAAMVELEKSNEKLREKVLAELKKENMDSYSDPELGAFYITRKTVWEYSADIKKMVEDQKFVLKAAQTTEKDNGKAKAEEVETFAYRAPKKNG